MEKEPDLLDTLIHSGLEELSITMQHQPVDSKQQETLNMWEHKDQNHNQYLKKRLSVRLSK